MRIIYQNVMVWYILTGSGGSGKTNLLLNLFKNKHCYRNKFHNIYYFALKLVFFNHFSSLNFLIQL